MCLSSNQSSHLLSTISWDCLLSAFVLFALLCVVIVVTPSSIHLQYLSRGMTWLYEVYFCFLTNRVHNPPVALTPPEAARRPGTPTGNKSAQICFDLIVSRPE